MMDKREMLERALEPVRGHLFHRETYYEFLDALAESKGLIVAEIEIIHIPPGDGFGAETAIETGHQTIYFDGHHGTPGPYLFIGLPLEEG